jgi:hypothetical protein
VKRGKALAIGNACGARKNHSEFKPRFMKCDTVSEPFPNVNAGRQNREDLGRFHFTATGVTLDCRERCAATTVPPLLH